MKAAVIERRGGVENLVWRDWPDPEIAADEAPMRIEFRAAFGKAIPRP